MTVEREKPIVILGCGESISALSQPEREYLSGCDVLIGLNKFMAFSDIAGITPTHVFFPDFFSLACDVYLQLAFDFCRRGRHTNVTFVLNKQLEVFRRVRAGRVTVAVSPKSAGLQLLSKHGIRRAIQVLTGRGSASVPARGNRNVPSTERSRDSVGPRPIHSRPRLTCFVLPPSCKFDYVTNTNWLEGGSWAVSRSEDLFHFRGSLTSAINYAVVMWPGRDVLLVGTDFYSSKYFFEDSERYKRARVLDYTSEQVQAEGKHFSAIEHEDSTIFDGFDVVNEGVRAADSHLYCANRRSLLVERGCVPFKSIESFRSGLAEEADTASQRS